MELDTSRRLVEVAPELDRILTQGGDTQPRFAVSDIRCETVWVTMRDGVRLATDVYLPPVRPAPTIAVRTPYGRGMDWFVGAFVSMARRGHVVVSQDCRGTGDSEPDSWDYYLYESEDSVDCIEWVSCQDWFDGFVGACGSSYIGQTQWCMAAHPRMSTIVPEVSGLGFAVNTTHHYMVFNAYARSVGKGEGKVAASYSELERQMAEETLAGGYFNDPLHRPLPESLLARFPDLRTLPLSEAKRRLWEHYCALSCAQRAALVKEALGVQSVSVLEVEGLSAVFGEEISHDALTLPYMDPSELCRSLNAPALIHTGWYDWGLNDALATWDLLSREARPEVASRSRLIITPSAHNRPGYHEGTEKHPELQHNHRTANIVGLLLHWYAAVREGTTSEWPRVIYYLMGANEWRAAQSWPPPEANSFSLYLGADGALTEQPPAQPTTPDRYSYRPEDPTPTVGGSIVSSLYPPGSVDVSEVQQRPDVLTYTTAPLEQDLDVVGPLRLLLYASSSAVDTDFSARLSDVQPDGRAIQIQSGMLRMRYRNPRGAPQLLVPDQIYCVQIDMWATAHRFRRGHRLRLDICSADFPRFDRNTNRGGQPGPPITAVQSVYHDPQRPSQLVVSRLPSAV